MAASADTKLYDILGVSKGSSDREIKKVRLIDHLITLCPGCLSQRLVWINVHSILHSDSFLFYFTRFPLLSGLSQTS